jgi:hypothetical protein
MILRQRLIRELEQLSSIELIIVQNFVQTLKMPKYPQATHQKTEGYLETRQALAAFKGNLSDDIIREREERI